jgi:predicted phage terminase large subunit-like protein
MTPSLLTNLLKLHDESAARDRIRTNLVDWAADVLKPADLIPAAHQRFLLENLNQVSAGTVKRLLVLMPPGSAKSTYTSVIFPIWWFMQHPRSSVIAASHTSTLVEHFSRRIQVLIEEHSQRIGFGLRPDDRSAGHWQIDTGGEYFAVGVRGAITGRRADLAIIDDPIKSMGEADSPKHRQYIWDWYTAELTTRLKPDARIVIVMTRWHEEDLGGQLIARKSEDWRVLRLPAIAEVHDPMGRPPGAPLWPEWETLEALQRKQTVVGSRIWSALFQQSPHPSSGRIFKVEELQTVHGSPSDRRSSARIVRAWDLAATPDSAHHDPDWTVGLRLVLEDGGRYVVDDIVRMRGNYRAVQDLILATARSDGHSVVISLPIDPGQAGKSQIAQLTSLLAGYRIFASREQGSKLSRALQVAAQIEAGNFAIQRASWNSAFVDELTSFPQGTKDDQVDALSRGFMTLLDFPDGSRRLFVPFNVR